MKNYLKSCTEEELQRIEKKLQQEENSVKKGKQRKFFLGAEYVGKNDIFEFLKEQNETTLKKIKEERERAWNFLNNEAEARKAGWFDRKQDQKKLLDWAEKAYPKITIDLFDIQFEQIVLKIAKKTMNKNKVEKMDMVETDKKDM